MKPLSMVRPWQSLVSAVQFLTIIPIRSKAEFDARSALPIVALVDMSAATMWTRPLVSLIDLVAMVVITGALHLDGVADTADGLYGRRDPEKALAIMKDSRIGAVGAVVMVCCMALKWGGIAGVQEHRMLWLVLIPAYARAAVLFGTRFLPYGRPGGTGHSFFQTPLHWTDFWGVALAVTLSLLAGWESIAVNLGFAGLVAVLICFYQRKVQCITGDMLGAMIEFTETFLFILAAAGDSL